MPFLATIMHILGDLLGVAAVLLPYLVLLGVLFSAIGRVRLTDMIYYWVVSLLLNGALALGIVAKAQNSALTADPNGILLQLSNQTILAFLALGLLGLVASAGLLLYVWNK